MRPIKWKRMPYVAWPGLDLFFSAKHPMICQVELFVNSLNRYSHQPLISGINMVD